MPNILTCSRTIYLGNPDDAAGLVKSQSSERIYIYCDYEEAATKMFAYIKFLCHNIGLNRVIIVSQDTDVAANRYIKESVTLHSYSTFTYMLFMRIGWT